MRQILSTVLAIHWVIVFSSLAVLCAMEPHAALLGGGGAACTMGWGVDAGCTALLGLSFATAASLFLWMLAECLMGRGERARGGIPESFQRACAGGVLALLPLLCVGLLSAPEGLPLPAAEVLLVAILASYLAVCAEHWVTGSTGANRDGQVEAPRRMALHAAHHTLLSRLTNRAGTTPGGRI